MRELSGRTKVNPGFGRADVSCGLPNTRELGKLAQHRHGGRSPPVLSSAKHQDRLGCPPALATFDHRGSNSITDIIHHSTRPSQRR
ncbi:hypothetical protein BDM02DRAFT_3113372 [Thelephora ganbajun]|uniref:Uncharacterized protein n=1 Tax=Thelephora ganbajun TaxID=370292 RepID=A0ACB6ZJE4_THEGA|nr:hypothetical protein BDM02DRAFT_3113372 [Thelephora ganbajun]